LTKEGIKEQQKANTELMKKPLSIIIYGRAGSGKGTQAKLLAEKFGLEHFSSGDALRQRSKTNDFTGKKLGMVMKSGKWVPPSTIIKIWMDKLEKLKQKKKFKGWVYDGGPRFITESELLNTALEWYEWQENIKIIFIDISGRVSFDRLTKRRQCKECGELIPWIGEFKKLKKCQKCKGSLAYRADDNTAAIKKRLVEFNRHSIPAMNYFKKKRKFIKINGEQPIEDVFKDILRALFSRGAIAHCSHTAASQGRSGS